MRLKHHLRLHFDMPEMPFLPGEESPIDNLSINIENSVVSHSWRVISFWLAGLHVPFNLCSSFRRQWLVFNISKFSHSSPLHSAMATDGCSNTINSNHWYMPTLLWLGKAHSTLRTWSNNTSQTLGQMAVYSVTTRGPQLWQKKILIVCCPGSTMVERAPLWNHDSRNRWPLRCRRRTHLFRRHLRPSIKNYPSLVGKIKHLKHFVN